MDSDYSCPICSELPRDCVESTCCGNIFCKQCSELVQQCPMCRSDKFICQSSKAIQRLINQSTTVCQDCGLKMTLEELIKHESNCEKKVFRCQMEDCDFQGKKDEVLQHLITLHQDILLKGKMPQGQAQQFEFMDEAINSQGKRAAFGCYQKFYCGGKLGGEKCNCCNGNCGPNDGCNCVACSELDIKFRNLPKQNYLVNKRGYICVFRKGRFYCGDQKCKAKMCNPCQALMHPRYRKFLVL